MNNKKNTDDTIVQKVNETLSDDTFAKNSNGSKHSAHSATTNENINTTKREDSELNNEVNVSMTSAYLTVAISPVDVATI